MEYFFILNILYMLACFFELDRRFNGKYKKIFCFVLLLPAFLMTAFRDVSVGNDTAVYETGYYIIAGSNSIFDAIAYSRMEPLYVLFTYVFGNLGLNYYIFQIAVTAFIYFSIYRFICKYSNNVALSCYIFLTLNMLIQPMNVVRMWIAIAFTLYSIPYILEQKFLCFIILNLVAMMFHYSAAAFMLMYAYYNCSFLKNRQYIVLLCSIVMALFSQQMFSIIVAVTGKYSGYLESGYFQDFNTTAIYLTLLVHVSIAIAYYTIKNTLKYKKENYNSMEYLCECALILIIACDVVGLTNTIMSRVSGYFVVFLLLLIPECIARVRPVSAKIVVLCTCMILMATCFWIIMIYRPGWNGVVPFTWFF